MSEHSKPVHSICDPAQVDRLLRLSPKLLADVERLHGEGHTLEDIIWHLSRHGVTKAGVESALRRSRLFDYADRKMQVHTHPAFADRRVADEHFEQQAVELFSEPPAGKRRAA